MQEEPRGAKVEFLGELFRLVGDEIVQSRPEHENGDGKDQVICFATLLELMWAARVNIGEPVLEPNFSKQGRDWCARLAEECGEMRRLWEEGSTVFARELLE